MHGESFTANTVTIMVFVEAGNRGRFIAIVKNGSNHGAVSIAASLCLGPDLGTGGSGLLRFLLRGYLFWGEFWHKLFVRLLQDLREVILRGKFDGIAIHHLRSL